MINQGSTVKKAVAQIVTFCVRIIVKAIFLVSNTRFVFGVDVEM